MRTSNVTVIEEHKSISNEITKAIRRDKRRLEREERTDIQTAPTDAKAQAIT